MLLCVAAVASIQRGSGRAVLLPDEVDGLELNAFLTPQDVEEFKKVSTGVEPGFGMRVGSAVPSAVAYCVFHVARKRCRHTSDAPAPCDLPPFVRTLCYGGMAFRSEDL
jgi:hypothetical protein